MRSYTNTEDELDSIWQQLPDGPDAELVDVSMLLDTFLCARKETDSNLEQAMELSTTTNLSNNQ